MNKYIKIDDKYKKLFKNISDITITNYEIDNDYVEVDTIITMLEDLHVYYNKLQEEFDDYKSYVKDNYKHISKEEQYL